MVTSEAPFYDENATLVERLTFTLQAAEIGTWDYNLETGVAEWSSICKELFGLSSDAVVTPAILLDRVHPEDREMVNRANKKAISPDTDGNHNITFRTLANNGVYRWVQAKGRTYKSDSGAVQRFAGIVQDVSSSVEARQQLQASQERFRTLIEEAPVATCLFVGRDLIIDIANNIMISFWGKDRSILGKPVAEAVPELIGQPFLQILDEVFTSGQTYKSQNTPVQLPVNGVLSTYYVDFTYKPVRNAQGDVYAVLETAIDVTEQVISRKTIEASETKLRSVIATAPAAMGLFIGRDLIVEMPNQAFIDIVGKGPNIAGKSLREVMPELITENQPFLQILDDVYTLGKTFQTFGAQVKIVQNGVMTHNYYNFTYSPLFDADGHVYAILDIAIDVTEAIRARQETEESEARYRALSEELENRVRQRTQEVLQINQDLKRSNENLQQFAYVASHDLQEPLRKIQSFSTLLNDQFGDELGDAGKDLLRRMSAAGARMSTLIKDLLTYSRVATRQQIFGLVSLDKIMANVLTTLEWDIQQRGARIDINELPVIKGDESQLGQLFQNLLSNALKFTPGSETPQIQIMCFPRDISELPAEIQLSSHASRFYQISVSDQGVGFDVKYLDRIFQVFQRLHARNEFPGTGVGLAICQRVVENHGGGITANSKPGEGATFHVFLPA
ncbi:PAS domain-containing sensor histidine kinase [Spirosoma validum]|uniref:histidine kinase n=1 Tax=Spirosoma validum TaxID=2771355 RepID=A0A927B4J3_9BACT|nr:ATP-binding protein [Spirosoma validum]MBD2755117.1 PAS domain-containing protein [Spirosoma validum]